MSARMTTEQYKAARVGRRPARNKYGAKRAMRCGACGSGTVYAGACRACRSTEVIRFDSKVEASHYDDLRQQQRVGIITGLKCQPRFPIEINGQAIGTYVADFSYLSEDGNFVVIDVKGGQATDTPLSKFKRKCVLAIYNIAVQIIRK